MATLLLLLLCDAFRWSDGLASNPQIVAASATLNVPKFADSFSSLSSGVVGVVGSVAAAAAAVDVDDDDVGVVDVVVVVMSMDFLRNPRRRARLIPALLLFCCCHDINADRLRSI